MNNNIQFEGSVKRPILRYHGGKWRLAKWIISYFPKHRIYVEPYGGAASVLMQKKRCYSEVYNDLDDEIVNLFNVVRQSGNKLKESLVSTPYSRKEFELSYQFTNDDFERARRTVVRSFMGFGSDAVTSIKKGKSANGFLVKGNYAGDYGSPSTGFRSNSNRSGTTPAHDWANYPDALENIISRLRGVVIEHRDALKVINQHDTSNTLFYLDPPYVLDTRFKGQKSKSYQHEMSNRDHVELCELIKELKGTVILSGYENEIYKKHLTGWSTYSKDTFADGAKKRKEVLWINKIDHILEREYRLFK